MTTQTISALPEIQPWLAVDDAVARDCFNQLPIAEFRANGGNLSRQFNRAPTNPAVAGGDERMVAQWPMATADYARATTRRIPLVVLERGGNS
jgi:hypothetical protein